jgi:potassium-transporting ATPase KdpC subunit
MKRVTAALRVVLLLTLTVGLLYPLAMTGLGKVLFPGQAAGEKHLIGQSFADENGTPVKKYFQSRPSAAGDGYDPTASGASNRGSADIVDTPDRPSLLTMVCSRSRAVGELEGVSGARPYCTTEGVGAVLGVFRDGGRPVRVISLNQLCPATPFVGRFEGLSVECAEAGADHSRAQAVPVRGDAPAQPPVPGDAVTASASGLDPHISVAYARLQAVRVAQARGLPIDEVNALVDAHTSGRPLGILGSAAVNVLQLNRALDGRA